MYPESFFFELKALNNGRKTDDISFRKPIFSICKFRLNYQTVGHKILQ